MNIPLIKLQYSFQKKPILVGGMAMEYYDLRRVGEDIDFIADEQDVIALIKQYPDRVKDIYSDLGVCPYEFEIWRSIQLFTYDDLLPDAIEEEEYFVISLEKLLLLKALAMHEEKYLKDTQLIAKKISDNQYRNYETEKNIVDKLLGEIDGISFIEKVGP